jgi:hypothetical protein
MLIVPDFQIRGSKMPDYTAIADVGDALIDILRENMGDLIPADSIVMASPGEIDSKNNVRLSLFLYQVAQNAHLRNQEMEKIDAEKLKYPPLALDLFYMLNSYPSEGIVDRTERTKEEHSVLGRAVQILGDNSIIKGSALKGSFAGDDDELHVSTGHISLDDLTKIWSTFQETPFRPTACYMVTPVRIESAREMEGKRVLERKIEKAVIE